MLQYASIYWASKSLLNRLRHVRSMLRVDCPRFSFCIFLYQQNDLYSKGIWISTAGKIGQDVINPTIHRFLVPGPGVQNFPPEFDGSNYWETEIVYIHVYIYIYTLCTYNIIGSLVRAIIASQLDLFFPLISGYQEDLLWVLVYSPLPHHWSIIMGYTYFCLK